MANETFDYRYFVDAPAEAIYAHLAEPASYIGLSPLVTAVHDISHSTDAQGRTVVHYVSVEAFNFLGFIHYDNHIRVAMTLTQPPRQIVSDVDSPFWVKVRFVFDLQPEGSGTWIHETVSARMPGIVRGFVIREAKAVQQARAQILKQRLDPGH
jgi:ligand-binding SRPBCC domain-containing protein